MWATIWIEGSLPSFFTSLADALIWKEGVDLIFHYLDDFAIVGPSGSDDYLRLPCMQHILCSGYFSSFLSHACSLGGIVRMPASLPSPPALDAHFSGALRSCV